MADIAKLGYSYDDFEELLKKADIPKSNDVIPHIRVSGISRADAKGSFLMSVWTGDNANGTRDLVGLEPVLSRWHVAGCGNCSTHLNVSTIIPLREIDISKAKTTQFEVLVHTRDKRSGAPSLGGNTPNVRVGQLSSV